MERSYLVRYGVHGQVGRFVVEPGNAFERGASVVVRTHRGIELGEVLTDVPRGSEEKEFALSVTRILRAADPDDLARGRQSGLEREARFLDCLRVFENADWPIEIIDVEPLLDDRRTVIYFLGSPRFEVAAVLTAFRTSCNLDVMLQSLGLDEPVEAEIEAEPVESGCGSCSSEGGCGTGGGCGSGTTSGSGGCGDCGVKKLLSARR